MIRLCDLQEEAEFLYDGSTYRRGKEVGLETLCWNYTMNRTEFLPRYLQVQPIKEQ